MTDEGSGVVAALDVPLRVTCEPRIVPAQPGALPPLHTEWVMLTSGTTGIPKPVVHGFAGLTAAIRVPSPADGVAVWTTFYDIRRYGGLQMFLRVGMPRCFQVRWRRAARSGAK